MKNIYKLLLIIASSSNEDENLISFIDNCLDFFHVNGRTINKNYL